MLISSVDYNLLRPLRALLEERSVTRAAERLRVSQPTMSIALGKLRTHFDDPLLVRRGNGHELTPLATRLASMLPAAMSEVERVFLLQSRFDPAASTRAFVIAGVDYAIGRIAPILSKLIHAEAPHVQLEFPAAGPRLVNGAPESLRMIDGLILPHGFLSDQPYIDLTAERWVCIVDIDSELGERATEAELLERAWVHTLNAREGMTPTRHQLQVRGIEVAVAAVTPYLNVIPSMVAGTDWVALVPEALAHRAVAAGEGVRIVTPEFGLDPLRDAFWWHSDREHDAEHIWLRDMIHRVRGVIGNSHEVHG